MNRFFPLLLLLFTYFSYSQKKQNPIDGVQIAFLADVHLQDLYGSFEDNNYNGIPNPKNGKFTLARTMESQLHSTRIFNENYFAFLAALDDIANRGIKYVALPGDYSDDGQPIHIRGLQKILNQYTEKHNISFFITTGNHDPVGPFAQEAGKNDFLGEGGKPQPIFSAENLYKTDPEKELPVVVTKDIAKMGYLEITHHLKDFGFFPKENYLFWTSPFATYSSENYKYPKAVQEAKLENRNYEVAKGFSVPDASYLVEPVEGLWLLAIDGNVYIPKEINDGNPQNSKNYKGADIGYNNVFSHKKHLIDWIKKITLEAKAKNKTLIAFSHYPMVEFNDDASTEIKALMGNGKWQLNRVPEEEVAQTLANAGLKIHFGGHMHINDTGLRTTANGNFLVNIQTPSLAAYIPAYKLLTIQSPEKVTVETITINEVPRFDELFELYKMEYAFLKQQNPENIWDSEILKTKNYHDFTDFHLKELVRLRFLPEDWPESFKNFMLNVSGEDLLLLSNMETNASFGTILKNKKDFQSEFKKAKQKIKNQNLNLNEFKSWSGFDIILDFYRIRSADEVAIPDIGKERIQQYQQLYESFTNNTKNNKDQNRVHLGLFLSILNKFLNGVPADYFSIDLKTGAIENLKK
ncbi:metallophosphoesterase family protein [Flavobacterium soli]|uniref:metallophosphoesterase family protein n=1 Tax=Flavobacterium soli TaxID=344881 RepID=UPI0004240198|nr:metallophosphoesterase [Flavobacterium soli]